MKAIVPGSYDPVTVGHLDIIKRAAEKYDEVYAVIFVNPSKTYRFSVEDMREHDIDLIVKGYRNDTDLEYERVQAEWNKANGGYDTELLPCDPKLSEVSSTRVRRGLDEGSDPEALLPCGVADYIKGLSKR